MMVEDDIRQYKAKTKELLSKRAAGDLSMADEAEFAELLDDIWRRLSDGQRMFLEEWLKSVRLAK